MSPTPHVAALPHQPAPNPVALLPLGLFLVLFIGAGLALGAAGTEMAFYQLSPTVAILPAIALALVLREKDPATAARPGSLTRRVNVFLSGAGEINIVTMCVIYLLAGGFASVASAIGGVESTVNLGLSLVPQRLVLPGLFVISAFVATAMGTSMGTIAAVGPIAAGVAAQTGMDAALLMGAVVGGAMFGDNLSMISDTTIAATRTQGCDMRDKFRMNFAIALPAALLAVAVFWLAGDAGRAAAPGCS
ncbi:Na+/H+ antiporter NhaC family protein, partial [Desulfovibrio oxamicus]